MDDYYTNEEWAESVEGRPMEALADEWFMTLHRHWIWANSAFRWFERELEKPAPETDGIDLTSDRSFSMYLWYSLLWSVIEGVQRHAVVIKGAFIEDLREVREQLHHARNAVMHVSEDAYYDDRLFTIMAKPDSAIRVRRVHKGYARLFLEELRARQQQRESGNPSAGTLT
jgi:hypothetical protein